MSKFFKNVFLWAVLCTIYNTSYSQISILTNHTSNNGSEGVTFNFVNGNSTSILIQSVISQPFTSGSYSYELYMNNNPVNGLPGAISTANGWNLIASSSNIAGVSGTNAPVITGMNYSIAAGDSVGFFLRTVGSSIGYMTLTGTTINQFTGSGCIILTGGTMSYGGSLSGPTNNPRGFVGGLTFIPAVPCSGTPTAGVVSLTNSNVCSATPIGLSTTGSTLGLGLSYSWKKSSSLAGPYTPFATTSNTTDTPTSSTYYFCTLSCGTFSANTDTALVTVPSLFPGGTYTINKNIPASTTNFTSFTSAVSAISCGTSGPVIFNVVPGTGPYNEQVIIPNINTNSATNTITFNGNGNELIYASSNTNLRATLLINGGDYITVDSLTITANTGTYGYGVELINNADNNVIKRCKVNSSMTTSSNFAGIVISGSFTGPTSTGSNCDSNTIQNNTVTGGYYGVTVIGNGTNLPVYGNKVIGNKIVDFYLYGLYYYASAAGIVKTNRISRPTRTTVSTTYGILIYYDCSATLVEGNRVEDLFPMATSSTSAMYGYYIYPTTYLTSNLYFINNQLDMQSGGGALYGIYYNGDNVKMLHNTINVGSPATTSTSVKAGMYIVGAMGGTAEFTNNIVNVNMPNATTGTVYAFYQSSAAYTPVGSNNWFYLNSASNNVVFDYLGGSPVATLANFQSLYGTMNNSIMLNPMYVNAPSNYQPQAYAYDNFGVAKNVTTDYNGNPRNLTSPDVGSVEFSAPPCTAPPTAGTATSSDTIICQNFPITLGLQGNSYGSGQTYVWQRSNTLTGTYVNLTSPSVTSNATLPADSTGYYRCKVKCGTDSSYSIAVYVFTNPALAGGTYTINQNAPSSATNFTSFGAAVNALTCGISGPIVLNVVAGSGPYNEQVVIPNIIGTSSTRTITINGNGEALTFAGTSTLPGTFNLNGCDYLTLNNLTIQGTSTTSVGVLLTNNSDFNTVNNCKIIMDSVSTTSTIIGLALSGALSSGTTYGSRSDSNTFSNNIINGGYYGVIAYGTSTTSKDNGNKFINNQIRNAYYYGLRTYYQDNIQLSGNDISRPSRTLGGYFYGYMVYYCNAGLKMYNNALHNVYDMNPSTGYCYGYYIYYSDATGNTPNLVYNNEMYYITHDGGAYGFYVYNSGNTKVRHNTINFDNILSTSTSTTAYWRGIYLSTAGAGVEIENNIINVTNGGSAIKEGLSYYVIPDISNHNDVWYNATDPNARFGYYNTSLSTLSAFQLATGRDSNSVNADPMIAILSSNQTPLNTLIDNLGKPVGVLTDYVGHFRSTTFPDLGSREFPVCNLSNTNIASSDTSGTNVICQGSPLTLSGPSGMTNYQWQLNGNNIPGATLMSYMPTTSGIYTVILDSVGCIGSQLVGTTVTVNPLPTVSAGADDSVCTNASYTLIGSGANSYTWNNGVSNNVPFVLTATGNYIVTGTNTATGCSNKDTVMLYAIPLPTANAGANQNICAGSGVILNGSGSGSLSWNNGVSNGVSFTPTSSGNYVLTVTNTTTGCVNTDTVSVTVTTAPTVSIINASINGTLGFNFTCNASNASSYSWNFGDGSTATIASPSHTYATSGMKQVTVTVTNSCGSATATIELPVAIKNIASQNGFSIYPNPAKDRMILENKKGYSINSIKLVSAVGSVIYIPINTLAANTQELKLESVSAGVYTLIIYTDKGVYNQVVNIIN